MRVAENGTGRDETGDSASCSCHFVGGFHWKMDFRPKCTLGALSLAILVLFSRSFAHGGRNSCNTELFVFKAVQ